MVRPHMFRPTFWGETNGNMIPAPTCLPAYLWYECYEYYLFMGIIHSIYNSLFYFFVLGAPKERETKRDRERKRKRGRERSRERERERQRERERERERETAGRLYYLINLT